MIVFILFNMGTVSVYHSVFSFSNTNEIILHSFFFRFLNSKIIIDDYYCDLCRTISLDYSAFNINDIDNSLRLPFEALYLVAVCMCAFFFFFFLLLRFDFLFVCLFCCSSMYVASLKIFKVALCVLCTVQYEEEKKDRRNIVCFLWLGSFHVFLIASSSSVHRQHRSIVSFIQTERTYEPAIIMVKMKCAAAIVYMSHLYRTHYRIYIIHSYNSLIV